MKDLFRGELVRLSCEEPDAVAKTEVRWQRDSEFVRLADGDPVRLNSEKRIREWITESRVDRGLKPERYSFWARTLEDDRLIGEFILSLDLIHSVAWVGIAIGERDFWGKGYGTDMMRLCLRYAFLELGLQRVSLGLHEYNSRALRSYEKAGRAATCCVKANATTPCGWVSCGKSGSSNMESSHERCVYR